jgi:hypothetical protein
MLKAIFAATVIFSVNSASADIFECRGNDAASRDYTVALINQGRVSIDDVPENTPVEFLLLIKNDGETIVSAKVLAEQEDVMFVYEAVTAEHGKIAGTIFMDELDQSSVRVEDMDRRLSLDCERTE